MKSSKCVKQFKQNARFNNKSSTSKNVNLNNGLNYANNLLL